MNSENISRILITLLIGAVLLLGFYFVTSNITKYTGYSISENADSFEGCLKEHEMELYINSLDTSESLRELGLYEKGYLEYFSIINCAKANKKCTDNEVRVFPTFIINNQKIERDVSLLELSEYSGCKFM